MINDPRQLNCAEFEELLSDYLEGVLGRADHVACATHVIGCIGCHELLNGVRGAVEACRTMSAPSSPLTSLELRIIEKTTPGILMDCENFEDRLTDYLDGFLEAGLFHRWERHAAQCASCTDLPGSVVRSIAACYTVKADELPVPEGLNQRILSATLGTGLVGTPSNGVAERVRGWLTGLRFPLPVPQLAPVAAIILCAFMFLGEGISADGSVSGVYARGLELANKTYKQGANVVSGEEMLGDGSEAKDSENPEDKGGQSR